MRARLWLPTLAVAAIAAAAICGGGCGGTDPDATQGVEGVVRGGSSRGPIAGATVVCGGEHTVSDSDGRYALVGLDAGSERLAAAELGYKIYETEVTIPDHDILQHDVYLSPSAANPGGICPRLKQAVAAEDSVRIAWTLGRPESSVEGFGGYWVWMVELVRPAGPVLVKEYAPDSDWPFPPYYDDSLRVHQVANDLLESGDPYVFSVSSFGASHPCSIDVDCLEANMSEVLYPSRGK
jgi:hypothetical protein